MENTWLDEFSSYMFRSRYGIRYIICIFISLFIFFIYTSYALHICSDQGMEYDTSYVSSYISLYSSYIHHILFVYVQIKVWNTIHHKYLHICSDQGIEYDTSYIYIYTNILSSYMFRSRHRLLKLVVYGSRYGIRYIIYI